MYFCIPVIQHGQKLDNEKNSKGQQEHQTEGLHLSGQNDSNGNLIFTGRYSRRLPFTSHRPPVSIVHASTTVHLWIF